MNGHVTCTDANRYQSECFWKCDPGYALAKPVDSHDRTSAIAKCTDAGSWSLDETPTCKKITCPARQLQENPHGEVVCLDGANFGSRCILNCYQGYSLAGVDDSEEVVCGDDGQWDKIFGVCTGKAAAR